MASPAVAAGASAAAASQAAARANIAPAAETVDGSELRGGFIIPIIALIAIILGIIAATQGNNDNLPHSP
jgi:hypothetical protein